MQQNSRWSENQLAILKSALADNDIAVTAIRKVFLEDELTENEQKVLETTIRKKPEVQEVLRRHYAPELKVDAPIGQVQDRLTSIGVQEMTPDMATFHAASVEKASACIDSHLEELFTGKVGMSYKSLYKLDLDDPVNTFIGLLARTKYVVDAERLTHHLQLLAGRKEESPSETMKRLQKDSSR